MERGGSHGVGHSSVDERGGSDENLPREAHGSTQPLSH